MHTQPDGSTPAPNAFTSEYLQLMNQRDEPVTSTAADVAGPWHLEPHPLEEGWAVQRQGASLTSSPAYASFKHKDAARLAAAVLPSTGRRPRYHLGKDPDALGYPIFDGPELVGHVQHFDPAFLAALNFADALISAPVDLAWLLDAAGGLALDHAGKIAFERTLPEF